jgi:hypothetical protein
MPSTKSYERINYALRPAKNVERKMIVDALQMLRTLAPLRVYRYVGFGSTFFSDFSLVHKALGIRNLVSIEENEEDRPRIAFNRPYRSIKLEFGKASEVLPRLTWRTKTIIWLDYDRKLDREKLDDVRTVCANASGGSVILVTVNAGPPTATEEDPLGNFSKRVGPENVPRGVKGSDLKKWGLASISREILDSTIKDAVSQRSRALAKSRRLVYRQLFHFHYEDGAKMVTVGGLLYYGRQSKTVDLVDFESLPFVRPGSDPWHIEVPSLTLREMKHLDRQLPSADPRQLTAPRVPTADLERYARLYRYFPGFVDAEL